MKRVSVYVSLGLGGACAQPDYEQKVPALLAMVLKRAKERNEKVVRITIDRHGFDLTLDVAHQPGVEIRWGAQIGASWESWHAWDELFSGPPPRRLPYEPPALGRLTPVPAPPAPEPEGTPR